MFAQQCPVSLCILHWGVEQASHPGAESGRRGRMLVADLLDDPNLGVSLAVEVPTPRLRHPVTGCVQSELMTPGEWVSPGEFLLTLGMALHVRDQRTWDAYVERLVGVRVSGLGFGLGPVHDEVPPGLLQACARHELPLVVLEAAYPLVKFSRQIWHGLAAERYEITRRGWSLADECTQLAADGALLPELLGRVADAVDGQVSLIDTEGFPIASTADTDATGEPKTVPGGARTSLSLPGAGQSRFRLQVITGAAGTTLLQPLLGPACAVIAMQLSYTLTARSPMHSHTAARLFESLLHDRATDDDSVIREFAVDAGFQPDAPWDVVVLRPGVDSGTASLRLATMRLRVLLERHYGRTRFFDEPNCATLLMQYPVGSVVLNGVVDRCLEPLTDMDAGIRQGLDFADLPITIQAARRAPLQPGQVHPLRLVDLTSVLDALPAGGLLPLAQRMLAPLMDTDGALLETLRAYLEFSGTTRRVCERLFIHRNTLAYRIGRIESLLAVDLGDGQTRATLLLSLQLLEHVKTSGPITAQLVATPRPE